jgi:hypothetical protein
MKQDRYCRVSLAHYLLCLLVHQCIYLAFHLPSSPPENKTRNASDYNQQAGYVLNVIAKIDDVLVAHFPSCPSTQAIAAAGVRRGDVTEVCFGDIP